MAGYIGSKASVVSSGAERKKVFNITGATTSLTGCNYTVGKVQVFQNGVRLLDGTDYTATNGTTVTLTVAAQSGDNVVVLSFASFQVADALLTTGGTMTGDLSFGDNDKAKFGAGDDLQIYHDGSNNHTYIEETGSGSLRIRGENLLLEDSSGKDYFNAVADAQVELSHNGVKKFETTSTGIDVTGTVTSDGLTVDGTPVRFNSTAPMLNFMEVGVADSNHRIRQNSGNLYIQKLSDDEGTATDRLIIDGGTGNVGINGLPNSGRKLHIEGNDASVGITLKDTAGGQFGINSDGGNLIFKSDSANSEPMLILSGGSKEFGTFQTENGGYNIRAGGYYAGSFAARFDGTGTVGSNVVQIVNGYGEVGSIKIASNGTTTNYNTSSDYRLKTDVQPVTDASARIQSLNPVNFEWIRSGTRTDGFLAHEAQAVVPDCVSGAHNEVKVWEDNEDLPDGVSVGDNKTDDNGDTIPVYQSIDQSKLVPLLTAALQEALTEIASLKTRVEALEA